MTELIAFTQLEAWIKSTLETIKKEYKDLGSKCPTQINLHSTVNYFVRTIAHELQIQCSVSQNRQRYMKCWEAIQAKELEQFPRTRSGTKRLQTWWATFCKQRHSILKQLCEAKLEKSTNVEARGVYTSKIQISVFYPGYEFACTGADCADSQCQKRQQRYSAQCALLQLCSYDDHQLLVSREAVLAGYHHSGSHFGWRVVAVTNGGNTVWAQRRFELETFSQIPCSELAIFCIQRLGTGASDRHQSWRGIDTQHITTAAPRYSQTFGDYRVHPNYRHSLRGMIVHYGLLQQLCRSNSVAARALPNVVMFRVCQLAVPIRPVCVWDLSMRTMSADVPNFQQMRRFMSLCATDSHALAKTSDLAERRTLKRKIKEVNHCTFVKLGEEAQMAQLCKFTGVSRRYSTQIWRSAGPAPWVLRPCYQRKNGWEIFNHLNNTVTLQGMLSAPLPHQHSIVAHLAWTPSKSLYLFWISQFQMHQGDVVITDRPFYQHTEYLNDQNRADMLHCKHIAQQYLTFLHDLHAVRDPGSGIWYIENSTSCTQIEQQITIFLQQQQLQLYSEYHIPPHIVTK